MNNIPDNLKELRNSNPECEFLGRLIEKYDVFLDIYRSCNNQFATGYGSYLFDGKKYEYCERMYEKQKLLYNVAKQCYSLLELGVYMGHSIFIVLLANPDIEITCIDIYDTYSAPALGVLRKKFNKKIDFIKNDSLEALQILDKKFDMFHIDSVHHPAYLEAEFSLCLRKGAKKNVFFVIDDYDCYPDSVDNLLIEYEKYRVVSFTIPECSWRNIAIEIQLPTSTDLE